MRSGRLINGLFILVSRNPYHIGSIIMGIAYAAFTIPESITLDMTIFGNWILMLLGVLTTMWVLRKLIRHINRS